MITLELNSTQLRSSSFLSVSTSSEFLQPVELSWVRSGGVITRKTSSDPVSSREPTVADRTRRPGHTACATYLADAWNRKLGQVWAGHLVQLCCVWSLLRTQQLNSTQLDTQPNVQIHTTCHNWISYVEMSRGLWSRRPIRHNSTSWVTWVELSPVARCDQGFIEMGAFNV